MNSKLENELQAGINWADGMLAMVRRKAARYDERQKFYYLTEEVTGCKRRFVRPVNGPIVTPAARVSPFEGGETAGALKDE